MTRKPKPNRFQADGFPPWLGEVERIAAENGYLVGAPYHKPPAFMYAEVVIGFYKQEESEEDGRQEVSEEQGDNGAEESPA